jgi:hypothetical protein
LSQEGTRAVNGNSPVGVQVGRGGGQRGPTHVG